MKSFLGFLVGTKKSALTVSSYKGDLLVFQEFLNSRKQKFATLSAKDLAAYDFFLKKRGLKTNTRRRKLLTARALYRYALRRKKIALSPAQFLKAPARREALPWIPTTHEVEQLVQAASAQSLVGERNRILFALIAETGLSIAELCALRWKDWEGTRLSVKGRREREITLSASMKAKLEEWRKGARGDYIFPGFNRHGFFTPRMTPRGVELSMESLVKKLGLPQFKPKSLRHHAVLRWIDTGVHDHEILRRLGVRKAYPLEPYKVYLAKLQR